MFRRFPWKKSPTSDPTSEVDTEAFGLKELSSGGVNPVLDIVAIHGLNGHRDKTWMTDSGINWLKDLLPEKIPNARIFSFGYDARTHGFVSQQHLHDHSVEFLSQLSLIRRSTNTDRRPIIFVAHSLGGIVCKSALILASAASESHLKAYKDIHISTYGILFFGTPHQGGEGIPLGKFLVNVASVFVGTNKKILKNLEMHSEFLLQQTTQYNAISAQFETKFFYETNETSTPFGLKMIVPKYSAVIPGAVNAEELSINRNHVEMVRFRSEQDEGFKKVYLVLSLMIPVAVSRIHNNWLRHDPQSVYGPSAGPQGSEVVSQQAYNNDRRYGTQNRLELGAAPQNLERTMFSTAGRGAPHMQIGFPQQRIVEMGGYIESNTAPMRGV